MKRTFILPLALVLLYSCEPNSPTCKDSSTDNILFTDPEPDLYTASSDTSILTYCHGDYFYFPSPENSTAFVDIDLDQDLVNDFRLTVSHVHVSAPTPYAWCSSFNYSLKITGLQPENKVSGSISNLTNNTPEHAWYFESGNTISVFTDNWKNELYIKNYPWNSSSWPSMAFGFAGTTYIGVMLHKNGENHCGWILLENTGAASFKIKSYAVNQTPGRCIQAGQE